MLTPSIFGENLLDDWFDFPSFKDFERPEKKLYGSHADRLMKTDVKEHEDRFELDVELPGFSKDEIGLELSEGYLMIKAAKSHNEDKSDKEGKIIRQERFAGAMQRTFYVGDAVTEEDIKASFKDGILNLTIPKKEKPAVPEKKTIMIEG